MKRALALAILALGMGAGATQAEGSMALGVGPYAGYNVALIQQDTGNGAVFGVRAPLTLVPMLTIEPFYAASNLGDVDETFGGLSYTRSGFDMKVFGATAIIGSVLTGGFKFYPFAGIGSYTLERSGSEDITETGYNFGFGVSIPAAEKIAVQLRGSMDMIVTDDTSRKFANGTIGVTYTFAKNEE
jgi:opacity protein-like surface antigen